VCPYNQRDRAAGEPAYGPGGNPLTPSAPLAELINWSEADYRRGLTGSAMKRATLCGAETLMEPKGQKPEFGIVRVGNLADLVIVPENPLHNLKVLYGTGTIRLDENGEVVTVGGVKWTVKDGIVYDAKKLLEDVARMVEEAKRRSATESGGI
jgi:hypothetical protein